MYASNLYFILYWDIDHQYFFYFFYKYYIVFYLPIIYSKFIFSISDINSKLVYKFYNIFVSFYCIYKYNIITYQLFYLLFTCLLLSLLN